MTRVAGVLYFALAAIVLILAITNFTVQFGDAAYYADNNQRYGLLSSTTDLRFAMGAQFLIGILVAGGIAIVGWFLYGSETEQYGYLIATGVLLIAMVVLRFTPLLPYNIGRLSPTSAFYGGQVALEVTADHTQYYVTLPRSDYYRVAKVTPETDEKASQAVLDFLDNQTLLAEYLRSPAPVKLIGTFGGTRTLARGETAGRDFIVLVPRIKVYRVGEQ